MSERPEVRSRGRLNPASWPVRWRLSLASAALTLAILLVFAAAIGHLTTERIRDDFDRELRDAATTLAFNVKVTETPAGPQVVGPVLDDFALPNDATVRVLDRGGRLLEQTSGAARLGPPRQGIADLGSLRVTTARVISRASGQVAGVVQYARSARQVESTIERLWLLIAAGVLGATILALLAGLTVADRAMRPIASLTAKAREIADTRDPSRHMPEPAADDEVGELARTLEQMLRSLDAAQAEREQAMQKQREFVADASHELRTPLTSVIANLELLEAYLRDSEEVEGREAVGSALRSSQRMTRLVSDLLLLARADAGRTGERRACDLAEITGMATGEVASFAGERSLEIRDGRPVRVSGNPDELHRMVVNLLENAIRHTPDGSRIEVRLVAADGRATLEIADDGPGLPEEMRGQVFDRFVRGAGPADTAGGGGTGLGLSIVRAVARSHGGEVEAGRSPLGGALFRVHLPLL